MISQCVFDTSTVLSTHGVSHAVISPGSRNAPLTLSLARNPNIKAFNIVDERSAGFIALGMALRLKQPVALCCTSGTSLLNYAPAIAEAYYQEIPLIVLSADRPAEWLGQRDGQTINQVGALRNFVKETYTLPSDTNTTEGAWEYTRKLNEACLLMNALPKGPVHLNIPFREPFYPENESELAFSSISPTVEAHEPSTISPDTQSLLDEWQRHGKRMIVVGQQYSDGKLDHLLDKLADKCVVVADAISNCHAKDAIRHQDLFLAGKQKELSNLSPDLLITIGKSVISKNLKLFLRINPPKVHWHFDEAGVLSDPFMSVSRMIRSTPEMVLPDLIEADELSDFDKQVRENFLQNWIIANSLCKRQLKSALEDADFCEFRAFQTVLTQLPKACNLHLANSMPVRYVNFINDLDQTIEVFANRGTSGIDGTNGAAVGCALAAPNAPTVLLSGDLSFFYDRNAFFHNYPMNNLKVVVFNNHGGGIFRLIKGPSDLPELEKHFETRHAHSAQFTAVEYGFDYHQATDLKSLDKGLKAIFKDDKSPKLLEIMTDPEMNQRVFREVKEALG